MRFTAETVLVDANERAKELNQEAYVYLVGTGLGVWRVHPIQRSWLKEVYLEILEHRELPHISDISFSWASSDP